MIGDYFSEQLLESIHRGAFELAYAGFQLMCQMLWRSELVFIIVSNKPMRNCLWDSLSNPNIVLLSLHVFSHPLASFNHLPIQWLTQVMLDIKSEDSGSKFCITRRSAGIPFFIQVGIRYDIDYRMSFSCLHKTKKQIASWMNHQIKNYDRITYKAILSECFLRNVLGT